MKRTMITMALLGLTTLAGCSTADPNAQSNEQIVARRMPFVINVPVACIVTQGGSRETVLTIFREADFHETLRLEVTGDGLNITPDTIWLKSTDSPELTLKISANFETSVGRHPVHVQATSPSGLISSAEFGVNVLHP